MTHIEQRLEHDIRQRIKICIWIVISGLALSGVTAFPLEGELQWLVAHADIFPQALRNWLNIIFHAIKITNQQYPYLSYGTDWLAFAHLMLAVLFFGPLKDPVKNLWVIEFGIIACICIIPLAFIAGSIRHIPIFWRFIDCSFGVVGIVPLIVCYQDVHLLETIKPSSL